MLRHSHLFLRVPPHCSTTSVTASTTVSAWALSSTATHGTPLNAQSMPWQPQKQSFCYNALTSSEASYGHNNSKNHTTHARSGHAKKKSSNSNNKYYIHNKGMHNSNGNNDEGRSSTSTSTGNINRHHGIFNDKSQHSKRFEKRPVREKETHVERGANDANDDSGSRDGVDDMPFITPEQTIPAPVVNNPSQADTGTEHFEALFDKIITQIRTQGANEQGKEKQYMVGKGAKRDKIYEKHGASSGTHQNPQQQQHKKMMKKKKNTEMEQQQQHADQRHAESNEQKKPIKHKSHGKQHPHHKGATIVTRTRKSSQTPETVHRPLGFDPQKSRKLQSSLFNTPATSANGGTAEAGSSKTANVDKIKNNKFDYVPNLDLSIGRPTRIPRGDDTQQQVIPPRPTVKQSEESDLETDYTMPSFLTGILAENTDLEEKKTTSRESAAASKKKISKPSKRRDTSPLRLFPLFAATTSKLGGSIYRRGINQLTQDTIMSLLPQDSGKSGSHSSRKKFQKLDVSDDPAVIDTEDQPPIALLSHNLERTLHSPGVHTIYNYKSDNYNFPPFLRRIHQPEEIDFRAITPFITTSKDTQLHSLAKQHNCSYKGSTSSLSGALTPLYMLLSNFRPPASRALPSFQDMTSRFTPATRKPNSIVIRPHPTDSHIYSIDSWKPPIASSNKILMDLGKTLERMLTMNAEEYVNQFVKNPILNEMRDDEFKYEPEAYTYMKMGKIMARSQLDCEWKDPQDNKNIVFDIKTRAINPVRINMQDYEKYTDHVIHSVNGITNSYEREFYDMVRSVFIKYSFQARIGHMDGMFVGYHNTKEMFGFEYIPLEEIDTYVFGSSHMGERALVHSTKLLEIICDTLTERHPGVALKTTLWVKKIDPYFMDIFVEPMPNDKGWSEESGDSWDALKQRFNPFDLNEEVYCYRLAVEVYVNGKLATGYVDFSPEDKVEVTYNLQLRATNKTDPYLFTEYQDVIKRSVFLR